MLVAFPEIVYAIVRSLDSNAGAVRRDGTSETCSRAEQSIRGLRA